MGLPAFVTMVEEDKKIDDFFKKYKKVFDLYHSISKKIENKKFRYIILLDLFNIEKFSEIYCSDKRVKENLVGVLILEEGKDGLEISKLMEMLKINIKHILAIKDMQMLDRIVYAWEIGAEDDLIASATILGSYLVIQCCNFERLLIPLSKIPPFKNIDQKDLGDFEIGKRGNYIFWPSLDTHFDLNTFRLLHSPKLKIKMQNEILKNNIKFGMAIRKLRIENGLTQNDFNLSDKQIRRFENGEQRPTLKAYELLSKAHNMDIDDYWQKLANAYNSL